MKFKYTLASLAIVTSLLMAPSYAFSTNTSNTKTTATPKASVGYKTIHALELKNWIDSGKAIQIVDARPKKYDKGGVIVGAKFLPYDSSEETIKKTLPSKDAVIVVYCASIKCPASGTLATQLVKMGYKNVYKYPDGLADWVEKKYPTSAPAS